MKKLAFFILLSLVTLGVSAQSNLKWNVNAGIGMSNWYGDDTDGTDAKFAYKVGIGLVWKYLLLILMYGLSRQV